MFNVLLVIKKVCFIQQPGSVCIILHETQPKPEFYVKLQIKGMLITRNVLFLLGFV